MSDKDQEICSSSKALPPALPPGEEGEEAFRRTGENVVYLEWERGYRAGYHWAERQWEKGYRHPISMIPPTGTVMKVLITDPRARKVFDGECYGKSPKFIRGFLNGISDFSDEAPDG